MKVSYTRKHPWQVWSGDVLVDEHNEYKEAHETATNIALAGNTAVIRGYEEEVKAYGVLNPTVDDTEAPSIPQNVTAIATSAKDVDVSWDASTDNVGVVEYQLWRDGVPIDQHVLGTSFSDTNLAPSTTYSYTVAAVDLAGNNSGFSDPAVVITDPNSAPVWSIGQQDLVVGTAYSLDLNTVCSDADGDTISYSIVSGVLPAGISLNGSVLQGTPTTVEVQIVTLGASDGIAPRQDEAVTFSVTAQDTTPPGIPTGLVETGKTQNTASMDWDDNPEPDLEDYQVYRSLDGVNWGPLNLDVPLSEYTDTGLNANTTYWYRVSAQDTSGNFGGWGDPISITTLGFGQRVLVYEQGWDSIAGAQANYGTGFIPGGAFVRAMVGTTWIDDPSQLFNFDGDLTIESSVSFQGSTITPRAGAAFLWSLIYDPRQPGGTGKTYDNGDPRWDWNIGGANNQGYLIDYDREVWIGFSIFLPLNYDHDKAAGFYNGDVTNILQVGDPNAVTSNYAFTMSIGPDDDAAPYGSGDAHWMIDLGLNPSGPGHVRIDSGDNSLGEITDDRDNWTDFVIRFRNSPDANGIFQLWKSKGPSRTMTLITEDQRAGNSTQLSYVNEPIGALPSTLGMALSPRVYKFNFDNQPTDSISPIGIAWDEWRHGYDDLGTGYSDVHPTQSPQPVASEYEVLRQNYNHADATTILLRRYGTATNNRPSLASYWALVPGVGGTFLEPTYGFEFKVVSTSVRQINGERNHWNADASKAFFRTSLWGVGIFDGNTGDLLDTIAFSTSDVPTSNNLDTIRWHPTDPDLLVFANGDELVTKNINTKANNVLMTFASDLGSGGRRIAGGDGNDISRSTGRFLLSVGGQNTNIQVYEFSSNSIITTPFTFTDIDYATLTEDGQYIVAQDETVGDIILTDLSGTQLGVVYETTPHMEVSRWAGKNVVVTKQVGATAATYGRNSGDLSAFDLDVGPFGKSERLVMDWQGGHGPASSPQFSASQNTDVVLVTHNSLTDAEVSSSGGWSTYYGETAALSLDPADPAPRRIMHNMNSPNPSASDQPECWVSPDGTKMFQKTDFQGNASSNYLLFCEIGARTPKAVRDGLN